MIIARFIQISRLLDSAMATINVPILFPTYLSRYTFATRNAILAVTNSYNLRKRGHGYAEKFVTVAAMNKIETWERSQHNPQAATFRAVNLGSTTKHQWNPWDPQATRSKFNHLSLMKKDDLRRAMIEWVYDDRKVGKMIVAVSIAFCQEVRTLFLVLTAHDRWNVKE